MSAPSEPSGRPPALGETATRSQQSKTLCFLAPTTGHTAIPSSRQLAALLAPFRLAARQAKVGAQPSRRIKSPAGAQIDWHCFFNGPTTTTTRGLSRPPPQVVAAPFVCRSSPGSGTWPRAEQFPVGAKRKEVVGLGARVSRGRHLQFNSTFAARNSTGCRDLRNFGRRQGRLAGHFPLGQAAE